MAERKPARVYDKLTPTLAFQLAAPHTWVAAITPVLFSVCFAAICTNTPLSLFDAFVLLAICILMQSAVNVFDDYFDVKRGTDSLENSSEDEFDAVLVYNQLNPKSVLALGIGYLAAAGLLGAYVVSKAGVFPLVIGIIGALVVVLYAGGKTPLSHLPVGELVSGFVMGMLIPFACTYVLLGYFNPLVILTSLPLVIGIGLINYTNNTCDIEKDREARRQTVPVMFGREQAKHVYNLVITVWLILITLIIGLLYSPGIFVVVIMLIALIPLLRAIKANPFVQASRDAAMSQVVMLNVIANGLYCAALLASSAITWMF